VFGWAFFDQRGAHEPANDNQLAGVVDARQIADAHRFAGQQPLERGSANNRKADPPIAHHHRDPLVVAGFEVRRLIGSPSDQ